MNCVTCSEAIVENECMCRDRATGQPLTPKLNRRDSFNTILPLAIEAATSGCLNIYVVFCPFYKSEHDIEEHSFGPQGALALLFPRKPWMSDEDWQIDATIHPDGSITYSLDVIEVG